MEKLTWLDAYSGQTIDELLALEGTHRIDSILVALDQALGQKQFHKGDASLSEAEWTVLAVESLESEVNGGGFESFFNNSSAEFVPHIVDSLRRINCPQVAAITEQAIAVLQLSEVTLAAVEAAMQEEDEDRSDALEELDEQFMAYPENIATHLFEYAKTNRSEIQL